MAGETPEVLMLEKIHCWLGHIALETAKKMVSKGSVNGIDIHLTTMIQHCNSCKYVKATRKPIKKTCKTPRATRYGEKIHSDMWGPSPVQTPGWKEYYISFTDDYTYWTHVMYCSLCPFHSLYHGLYVSRPSHSFLSHYLFSRYSVLWSFHPLPVPCSTLHSILTIFVLSLGTLQVTFRLSTVMPIILATSIIPCPVYPSSFDPLVSPLSWHYLIGFAVVALSWIVLKLLILVVSFPSLLAT